MCCPRKQGNEAIQKEENDDLIQKLLIGRTELSLEVTGDFDNSGFHRDIGMKTLMDGVQKRIRSESNRESPRPCSGSTVSEKDSQNSM